MTTIRADLADLRRTHRARRTEQILAALRERRRAYARGRDPAGAGPGEVMPIDTPLIAPTLRSLTETIPAY